MHNAHLVQNTRVIHVWYDFYKQEVIPENDMDIIIFLKAIGNLVFASLIFLAMLMTTVLYLIMYMIQKQVRLLPRMIVKTRLPASEIVTRFRKSASDVAETLVAR